MEADGFHPDLRRIARWLPRTAVGPRSLAPMRALTGLVSLKPAPAVTVERFGPVSVRLHRPARTDRPLPALLWIHGGGYVMGTAAQDDHLCRHFADALGIVVAAVDYRLAPEHRYPVPLHDCYEALVWLAGRDYVDRSRIAVGGGSAGGGLAAAVALFAHERAEVALCLQLLAYPMLDDRTALRDGIDQRRLRLWNQRSNRFGWEAYTGEPPGSDRIPPLAAPSRYEDLTGLPPTWIGVGTLDLFHDEDLAYAGRLRAAGVDCTVSVVEGAFHGFDSVVPGAGVSRSFRAAQVAALAGALCVSGGSVGSDGTAGD